MADWDRCTASAAWVTVPASAAATKYCNWRSVYSAIPGLPVQIMPNLKSGNIGYTDPLCSRTTLDMTPVAGGCTSSDRRRMVPRPLCIGQTDLGGRLFAPGG